MIAFVQVTDVSRDGVSVMVSNGIVSAEAYVLNVSNTYYYPSVKDSGLLISDNGSNFFIPAKLGDISEDSWVIKNMTPGSSMVVSDGSFSGFFGSGDYITSVGPLKLAMIKDYGAYALQANSYSLTTPSTVFKSSVNYKTGESMFLINAKQNIRSNGHIYSLEVGPIEVNKEMVYLDKKAVEFINSNIDRFKEELFYKGEGFSKPAISTNFVYQEYTGTELTDNAALPPAAAFNIKRVSIDGYKEYVNFFKIGFVDMKEVKPPIMKLGVGSLNASGKKNKYFFITYNSRKLVDETNINEDELEYFKNISKSIAYDVLDKKVYDTKGGETVVHSNMEREGYDKTYKYSEKYSDDIGNSYEFYQTITMGDIGFVPIKARMGSSVDPKMAIKKAIIKWRAFNNKGESYIGELFIGWPKDPRKARYLYDITGYYSEISISTGAPRHKFAIINMLKRPDEIGDYPVVDGETAYTLGGYEDDDKTEKEKYFWEMFPWLDQSSEDVYWDRYISRSQTGGQTIKMKGFTDIYSEYVRIDDYWKDDEGPFYREKFGQYASMVDVESFRWFANSTRASIATLGVILMSLLTPDGASPFDFYMGNAANSLTPPPTTPSNAYPPNGKSGLLRVQLFVKSGEGTPKYYYAANGVTPKAGAALSKIIAANLMRMFAQHGNWIGLGEGSIDPWNIIPDAPNDLSDDQEKLKSWMFKNNDDVIFDITTTPQGVERKRKVKPVSNKDMERLMKLCTFYSINRRYIPDEIYGHEFKVVSFDGIRDLIMELKGEED